VQFTDFLSLAYAELYSMLECMLSKPDFALIEKDTELAYDGFEPLSPQESGFDAPIPYMECQILVNRIEERGL